MRAFTFLPFVALAAAAPAKFPNGKSAFETLHSIVDKGVDLFIPGGHPHDDSVSRSSSSKLAPQAPQFPQRPQFPQAPQYPQQQQQYQEPQQYRQSAYPLNPQYSQAPHYQEQQEQQEQPQEQSQDQDQSESGSQANYPTSNSYLYNPPGSSGSAYASGSIQALQLS